MPAAKKPQLLQSISRAASNLLKSFKINPATTTSATASTSAPITSPKTLKKENLSEIAFRSPLYSTTTKFEDESLGVLTSEITSILCGEIDYDNKDSDEDISLKTDLEPPWFPSFSNNSVSNRRKETSRERKEKSVFKNSQFKRFDQLVKLCGNELGVANTLTAFVKLGRKTGMKEYKALLALCMGNSRETDDHEVQIDQNFKAYQIFQSMKERGFPIEEEMYGPFLKYLTDADMVQEFFFFSDIFKHDNPASLPKLAYYEMLLYIRLNNEDKIKQLLYDYLLYDGEDKHSFQESYLLALCESDCRRELLMLLETFDVTKASSKERLSDIFKSLGMLSLESYAQKFLLELKTSGTESAILTKCIYDYAINIPNLVVEDTVSIFKHLHSEMEMKPTFTQYEKLIRHFCKLLKVHEAIDLADEMINLGATSSLETIHAMLDACMESYEYNMVHRIYSMIRRQGLKPNKETFRILISLTVRMKDFNGAYDMLREMVEIDLEPTIDIYNTIMAGYFRKKNICGAMAVLKQMEQANVKPNSHTFSYLISNCNSEEEIVKIFDELKESGVQITKHVSMALINSFASCGAFEKAKQVIYYNPIAQKNYELRGVLVSALASHGQLSDALTIYEESKQANCSLEPKAVLSLIEHLQSEGQLARLLQLQEELRDPDYWIDGCYRVIRYCVRHNHLSSAVEFLKKIKDYFADDEAATESIFDEVFVEFADQEPKDMKFGLELLRAIKEELGLQPSRKVLDFLLDACVSANDLETAFLIWKKEYPMADLPYNILSYLRMYRTLLALGDLESAEEIVRKIPQGDHHISHLIKGFQDTYLGDDLPEKIKTKSKNRKKKSKATEA